MLEPLDPQETEEPTARKRKLVPDVIADPPSAGGCGPGSVREDVPDLEDMELTNSLIGHMVDNFVEVAWAGPLARS